MEGENKPEELAVTPPESGESAVTESPAPRAAPPPAPLEETPEPPAPEPAPQETKPRPETPAPPSASRPQDFREVMQRAKMRKREVRLEKILAYVREKGRVTNDDIQKLLRVSDATATRYAAELVRRSLVEKVGRGRAAYYGVR